MQSNITVYFFTQVEETWPPILTSPADDKEILPRECPPMLKIEVGLGLLQLRGVCKSREREMVGRFKCAALCLPREHVSTERHVGIVI